MKRPPVKTFSRDALERFVAENLPSLTEEEAVAVLENAYVTPKIASAIAQNARLTAFHAVRLKLVALRQTPLAHATKLVHYLYWPDMLRLSIDVTVPPPVRRALETVLLTRVEKLTLGERISSARLCSTALIRHFLFDPDVKVVEALLVNARLREDDLLLLVSSPRASAEALALVAGDRKWSFRREVRKALVLNPRTPRAVAASQLRHLSGRDLAEIHSNPAVSVFLRRCIEGLSARAEARVESR